MNQRGICGRFRRAGQLAHWHMQPVSAAQDGRPRVSCMSWASGRGGKVCREWVPGGADRGCVMRGIQMLNLAVKGNQWQCVRVAELGSRRIPHIADVGCPTSHARHFPADWILARFRLAGEPRPTN